MIAAAALAVALLASAAPAQAAGKRCGSLKSRDYTGPISGRAVVERGAMACRDARAVLRTFLERVAFKPRSRWRRNRRDGFLGWRTTRGLRGWSCGLAPYWATLRYGQIGRCSRGRVRLGIACGRTRRGPSWRANRGSIAPRCRTYRTRRPELYRGRASTGRRIIALVFPGNRLHVHVPARWRCTRQRGYAYWPYTYPNVRLRDDGTFDRRSTASWSHLDGWPDGRSSERWIGRLDGETLRGRLQLRWESTGRGGVCTAASRWRARRVSGAGTPMPSPDPADPIQDFLK